MLLSKIKSLADKNSSYLSYLRQHFHANPELSFAEYQTAAFIENELHQLGLQPERMAGTGLTATIRGCDGDKKVVALRTDMDALPIHEMNDESYRSKNDGVMHACGHDAHMTMLLGAARILSELKNEFSGSVKLIFQPAEEKVPGGAKAMIEKGVLENPPVSLVVGQHVLPELPAGKAGFCPGYFMASSDEIYIKIIGKGGHAAMPWKAIDPVSIMAQVITAVQQLISRQTPATIPAVLSFGKVVANGAVNVIPEEAYLEGTFRTFDENYRCEIHQKLPAMVSAIASGMGAKAETEIRKGYPALYNDPALTAGFKELAKQYLGADNVVELPQRMTSEDFAYFSLNRPSVFYRLGSGFSDKESYPLHHSRFDLPESILGPGSGLMAFLAISSLK